MAIEHSLTKKNYSKLQFTIVNYSLLYFKTMVLWNFDLLWKTMVLWKKTMVLWTKLWYYTENYRTSIQEEKKHGRLPNTKKL